MGDADVITPGAANCGGARHSAVKCSNNWSCTLRISLKVLVSLRPSVGFESDRLSRKGVAGTGS